MQSPLRKKLPQNPTAEDQKRNRPNPTLEPYTKTNMKIQNNIKSSWSKKLDETRTLKNIRIISAFRRKPNLKDLLTSSKLKTKLRPKTNTISKHIIRSQSTGKIVEINTPPTRGTKNLIYTAHSFQKSTITTHLGSWLSEYPNWYVEECIIHTQETGTPWSAIEWSPNRGRDLSWAFGPTRPINLTLTCRGREWTLFEILISG